MTRTIKKEKVIEKALRFLIIFVTAAAFVLPMITPSVFAASTLSINTKDSVKGGETFTVSVVFGGGDVGRVDAQLTYDTDMLTYISGGSSDGNSGYIQLAGAGIDGSVVFNIEFQALTDGEASIEVLTNEIYNLDEMDIEPVSATKVLNIEGNVKEDEKITQTSSPDQPVAATDPVGVDMIEDEEEEQEQPENNVTYILIAAAVVIVILIVIISVIAAGKKKFAKKAHSSPEKSLKRNPRDEFAAAADNLRSDESQQQSVRIGRSGRPLDYRASREDTFSSRKTQILNEWDFDDREESDDIDKW